MAKVKTSEKEFVKQIEAVREKMNDSFTNIIELHGEAIKVIDSSPLTMMQKAECMGRLESKLNAISLYITELSLIGDKVK